MSLKFKAVNSTQTSTPRNLSQMGLKHSGLEMEQKQTCWQAAEPEEKKRTERNLGDWAAPDSAPVILKMAACFSSLVTPANALLLLLLLFSFSFWEKIAGVNACEIFQKNTIPQNRIATSNYDLSDPSGSRGAVPKCREAETSHDEVLITPQTRFSQRSRTHIFLSDP